MNEKVCLTGSLTRWLREAAIMVALITACFCAQMLTSSEATPM